jgi:hypothetical protein
LLAPSLVRLVNTGVLHDSVEGLLFSIYSLSIVIVFNSWF